MPLLRSLAIQPMPNFFTRNPGSLGWLAGFVFTTLAFLPGSQAAAAGLQISPISLTIPSDKKADEIWLRNAGDDVVHAQVRVYRWSQADGEDVLTPDTAIAASPPMVQVAPDQQQLVRVVRVGALAAPAAQERSYRVLIDELPIKKANAPKAGLDFVFRYSVPVFIAGTGPQKPQLEWSVQQQGQHAWLLVRNSGSRHGQLADISFKPPNGKSTVVAAGLAGYVLPGQYRRLQLAAAPSLFAQGGSLTLLLNGVQAKTNIAPITKAP